MGADPDRRVSRPLGLLADWFWVCLLSGTGVILLALGLLVWHEAAVVVAGALVLLAPLAYRLVD
jgi:hypothetical protein